MCVHNWLWSLNQLLDIEIEGPKVESSSKIENREKFTNSHIYHWFTAVIYSFAYRCSSAGQRMLNWIISRCRCGTWIDPRHDFQSGICNFYRCAAPHYIRSFADFPQFISAHSVVRRLDMDSGSMAIRTVWIFQFACNCAYECSKSEVPRRP